MCTREIIYFPPPESGLTVPIDNEPQTNANADEYSHCVPLIFFRSGACSVDAYYPSVTLRITFTLITADELLHFLVYRIAQMILLIQLKPTANDTCPLTTAARGAIKLQLAILKTVL